MQVVDKILHHRRKQRFLSRLEAKFEYKTANRTPDSSNLKAAVLATFNSHSYTNLKLKPHFSGSD